MLRAIDISSWQEGIVPSHVDCDIVIVKATGGAGYTNPYFREWADDVLASGKLLGLYHFAAEKGCAGSAADEARHFLDAVGGYKGRFVPILDWEADALWNPASWAREWLDIVAAETGATPMFYAYASNVAHADYSELARYPLWMASYLYRYDGAGWVDDPDNTWGTGSWERMLGYQYTSTGHVDGWDGDLDLSVFYMGRGDWLSMQGGNMNRNAEIVDLLMPISTRYVLGGSRYEPRDTDCSGIVCAGFYQVFGLDPYVLGVDTGSQWNRGTLAKLWWGTTPDLPWGDMYKGDVIFTSNCSPDFSTVNGSHVGFYTGDPGAPFQSHFADGGPFVTAVNGVYGGTECYFGVARYLPGLEDDVSASDVWNYVGDDTPFPTGADAWVRLVYIDKFTNETVETVRVIKELVDGLSVGGIDYAKLAEAVASAIDYDRLAAAVADEQARRMAE